MNGLPDVTKGLAEITSKSFYLELRNLRPDLAGLHVVNSFFKGPAYWLWLKPPQSDLDLPSIELSLQDFRTKHDDLYSRKIFEMPLHVPMRQYWMDDEDLIRLMEMEKEGVDPTAYLYEYFENAARRGSFKVVKVLVGSVHRVHLENGTGAALASAMEWGPMAIVDFLLDIPEVNGTYKQNMAIRKASEKGYLNIVKVLLEKFGVDPADCDNEALRKASEC
ncbi:hypothetical protein HDU76_008110 [Blyttiomyces sp. JEL0837]|nr:hypothetical protein HDU76_008110 [Blyttiomyces sp. JEL0837]